MFVAVETGIALDFFVAENFSRYIPVYYNTKIGLGDEAVYKKLNNDIVLKTIENLAAIRQNDRDQIIAEILLSNI